MSLGLKSVLQNKYKRIWLGKRYELQKYFYVRLMAVVKIQYISH